MKKEYVFLSALLAIALTMSVFGQATHGGKTKNDMKKHDMSSMMGKPTVDATVEGLHMKVWLMTQKQHKKMMMEKMGRMTMGKDTMGMKHDDMKMNDTSMAMGEDMKGTGHDDMGMDKATKEAMMAGTHVIMLDATDAASGEEISNASAKVLIVSPSKKSLSVDLKTATSHFGNGITLDEKGKYRFTVSVNLDGVSKSKEFRYLVK